MTHGRADGAHWQVFSHPGFLVNLAEDDDDVATSLWLLPDLLRYPLFHGLNIPRYRLVGCVLRRRFLADTTRRRQGGTSS